MNSGNNMVPGIDEYIQNVLAQSLGAAGIGKTEQSEETKESEDNNPSAGEPPVSEVTEERKDEREPEVHTTLKPKIIEIHGFIIVRIKIPEYIDINHLNIEYDSTRLVISGFSQTEDPIEIMLPFLVRRRAGKAIFRKNILEIRLIKHEDDHMIQIPIRRK